MLSQEEIGEIKEMMRGGEEKLLLVFDALSDPGRLGIFRLLTKRHDICVTDVARIFEISLPAASHQLKILERAGLVKRTRMGQMICYEIKEEDNLVKSIISLFSHENI
ncbi:MAG: winged helix-turn-helix transcriptional regulator [Candidatus Portnoybacteria bacterium]|nr:winged helix-turn-helix transcriptional regulator [Candidatus Portnoybacteria bacterium]